MDAAEMQAIEDLERALVGMSEIDVAERIRVLEQSRRTMLNTIERLVETIEKMQKRVDTLSGDEGEYVADTMFRDPSVG